MVIYSVFFKSPRPILLALIYTSSARRDTHPPDCGLCLAAAGKGNLGSLELLKNAVLALLGKGVLGAEVIVVTGHRVEGGVYVAVGGPAGDSLVAAVACDPVVGELAGLLDGRSLLVRVGGEVEGEAHLRDDARGLLSVLGLLISAEAEEGVGGFGAHGGDGGDGGEALHGELAAGGGGLNLALIGGCLDEDRRARAGTRLAGRGNARGGDGDRGGGDGGAAT
mmetsp:Transcript_8961/g.39449  ORF Transcript_8961/g.39449 Transcript_8961/m.39449 type:complete len:223 (-) Transcript_8961:55-723(-)